MEKLKDIAGQQYALLCAHTRIDIHYCREYNYEINKADDIYHIYYYNGDERVYVGFYFSDLYFVPAAKYRHNLRSSYPSFIRTFRMLLENIVENKYDTRMEVYYERV